MTTRQEAALEFIAKNQRTTVVGPSLRELAAHLGVFPNAAQYAVVALRELGLVSPNKRNGLVATRPPRADGRAIERAPILKPSAKSL